MGEDVKPKIYVSGPISNGNTATPSQRLANVRKAMAVFWELVEADFSVLLPQLTEYIEVETDRRLPHAEWIANDLPWVLASDAVFRMEGASKGADEECEVARQHGIPVFTTVARAWEHFNSERTILEEAQEICYGDRNRDYGHPADDYARTAALWSAILGHEVTAEQAVLCMVAVKISREVHRPKRDNRVDIAGYADCLERIAQRRANAKEAKTNEA